MINTKKTVEQYRNPKHSMDHERWEEIVRIPPVFRGLDPIDWKNTLFIGPAGSGKSYKAARMLQSIYESGDVPKWINIPKLLFDLRTDFDHSIIDKLLRKDYIVLDDLGAEHTTDWVTETIYIIVNYCWENNKNLVVTSNLEVREIANRFGDRLASRLLDICEVKHTKDKDYRLEK